MSVYTLSSPVSLLTKNSNAVSLPSQEISNRLKEIKKDRTNHTITYGMESLLLPQILNIKKQCDHDHWDGYDASRVTNKTIINASIFLEQLPEGIMEPDITPESTGAVSFYWETDKGLCFSVSVDQDNIYYAGLLAREKIHGEIQTFYLSKMDKIIGILYENFIRR